MGVHEGRRRHGREAGKVGERNEEGGERKTRREEGVEVGWVLLDPVLRSLLAHSTFSGLEPPQIVPHQLSAAIASVEAEVGPVNVLDGQRRELRAGAVRRPGPRDRRKGDAA